jgi:protein TonB
VIRPKSTVHAESQFVRDILVAPVKVPPKAAVLIDDAPLVAGAAGVEGGVVGGDPNGVVGGILRAVLSDGARPVALVKPPDAAPVQVTKPVVPTTRPPRVSVLEMARPIQHVEPIYPPLARQMRVSGVVQLQGVLGTDGHIHELKVISGHALLINAAVDAVSKWIYAPTILNGQAVEVAAPLAPERAPGRTPGGQPPE